MLLYKKSCSINSLTLTIFITITVYCYFTLQYKLETFTENRKTKKKKIPYKGGHVDGPDNGTPPQPWEIECRYKKAFKDDKIKSEVAHTAKVKVSSVKIKLIKLYF